MRKGRSLQSGLAVITVVALVFIIILIGGAALYLRSFLTKAFPSKITTPKRGIIQTVKPSEIPIYPGSRKVEQIDMVDPEGKALIYAVKAEPRDIAYFYVDELKKLGEDVNREFADQQIKYGSMTPGSPIMMAGEWWTIQIGTQKDENGEIVYQVIIFTK